MLVLVYDCPPDVVNTDVEWKADVDILCVVRYAPRMQLGQNSALKAFRAARLLA
jgi:hypothetical protein